jgi:hypothetical protein
MSDKQHRYESQRQPNENRFHKVEPIFRPLLFRGGGFTRHRYFSTGCHILFGSNSHQIYAMRQRRRSPFIKIGVAHNESPSLSVAAMARRECLMAAAQLAIYDPGGACGKAPVGCRL